MAKNRGAYKGKKRGKELRRQEKQERKRKRRFGKGDTQKNTERTDREVSD